MGILADNVTQQMVLSEQKLFSVCI